MIRGLEMKKCSWSLVGAVAFIVGVVGSMVGIAAAALSRKSNEDAGALPGLQLWRADAAPFTLVVGREFFEHTSLTEARLRQALSTAIDFWNEVLPLFVRIGEWSTTGEVVPVLPSWKLVSWDDRVSDRAVGYTRLALKGGRIWSAAVYCKENILVELTDTELWRVLAHELGHVLGLAHDEDSQSIMSTPALDAVPVLSDKDRALLLETYGVSNADV